MVGQIIELKQKQINLLKELERNTRLLSKDYFVERGSNQIYYLVDSRALKVVRIGSIDVINSYLNLRNLFDKTIFDFNISLTLSNRK